MSPWQLLLSVRLTARKEQKIITWPINAVRRIQATVSLHFKMPQLSTSPKLVTKHPTYGCEDLRFISGNCHSQ